VVRTLLLIAAALLAIAPGSASAAPYAPPPGEVLHSGVGGYGPSAVDAFARQSGKRPAVFQYFVSWRAQRDDLRFFRGLLRQTASAGSRTMLSVSTDDTGLTPASIARGSGDRFLVELNRMLAVHPLPSYVRLLSEMNNGANPYSAYDLRGRSRGRAFSTAQFKRAWRRAALILRGGSAATVNARLARLGMPPVRGVDGEAELGRPRVALLWVPLSFGNPEIARNHPRHWWPGARYVDWVGTTWYSRYRSVAAMDRFYRHPLWRGKPFSFSEYGVWGTESPGFLRDFFRFVGGHPRVRMVSYYQSALLRPEFRLSTHPRSRAVLRRVLRSPRFLGALEDRCAAGRAGCLR
jgi:hypothetical protein